MEITKVQIVGPIVRASVAARADKSWPTYNGKTLDRAKFVSASEIGKCERQIWFSKNVTLTEGKPFYWGYAERGHSHEQWLVEQIRHRPGPYSWMCMGDQQVSFYYGHQSGTPDAIAVGSDGYVVVDFKSIDPRKNLSRLPAQEHLDQVVQNMDLVSVCLDVDVAGGLLVYSNASDYNAIHEFYICADDNAYARMGVLEARAAKIMNAKSPDDLAPEGIYNGGCEYCPFTAQCSGAIELEYENRERHKANARTASRFFSG